MVIVSESNTGHSIWGIVREIPCMLCFFRSLIIPQIKILRFVTELSKCLA